MIIASACLCGINCKYNGENNLNEYVLELFKKGKVIPVCPEQLGGLTTPRDCHEILHATGDEVLNNSGKVISSNGKDSSKEFIKGAYETLNIAKACNAKIAILKSKSPSCGFGSIYDGSFLGKKIKGNGVTAELLQKNGVEIYTEKEVERIKENVL
ncbi:uncharacterized protein YbbK (DUF523 family) [Clostridium tetanomorphum]|uniref:DUF523 domain-containing protein n=1 Tax=Clostridium tetanomorphum TaxID=1553 RepID=A0A923J1S4_CLOTT|nr:DUF523 domain-containing protein [Clostridium tetanomorphum]KAJ52291.1 hypothetical protein CTM_08391 [Clostridium tetanomorphum DSM 665]MBC2399536.1 DUF523 domain-containing protein [Clostridium tetanomorphum]MBP1866324.1 uncharacterized protein YbbK (DUF523 family) [Clostridium tetanomorphum]NRS85815.1 uncharacterized protein YbbK (DUF523 family) [Clostridium tetanomorphum]NRZ96176.1 uncharacterized protein YbbK (DUF523 family) [Clostridium tetanomorphum]